MNRRHLKSALFSILLLLAGPALAMEQTPDQLEQIKLKSAKWGVARQEAAGLVRARKFRQAEIIYKQIISERQALGLDLSQEYDLLGLMDLSWGKIDPAEEVYKAMIADREKQYGADDLMVVFPLTEYANCLDKAGKKDEAKKVRARAAAIEKDSKAIPKFSKSTAPVGSPERVAEAEKMRLLGEKCVKQDNQLKALAYFEHAVDLHPKDAEALRDRGDVRLQLDKMAQARADLDSAIALKPDFEKAYVSRGVLHDAQHQSALAIADFTRAVSLDAKDTETMGLLARQFEQTGKHKEAAEWYTKIIAANPALYWPYAERAAIHQSMGQYDLAIADYTTLIGRAPEDADYYEGRAAAYAKKEGKHSPHAVADGQMVKKLRK